MDGKHLEVDSLLAEATDLIRREKEAAGNAEPTEGDKRRQIEKLKEFATLRGLWIDFHAQSLSYLNKGGENEVFTSNEDVVFKLNNFEYAGDDLTNFFVRIAAHNYFFRNVAYTLMGFAYNSMHEFCAVLVQPYVRAAREASADEIIDYMEALGFEMDYEDEFHNEEYEIFDAVPNNVLYGIDGKLYFIDTQIRLRISYKDRF